MSVLCIALLTFGAAGLEARIAPDKVLPIVYAGEPLILGLVSDTRRDIQGTIAVSGTQDFQRPVGPLTLWPGEPRWIILDGVPASRGAFRCVLDTADGVVWEGSFVCVEQPRTVAAGPVTVNLPADVGVLPPALRHLSIRRAAFPWTESQRDALRVPLIEAGFDVRIRDATADAIHLDDGESNVSLHAAWSMNADAFLRLRAASAAMSVPMLDVYEPGDLSRVLQDAAVAPPLKVIVGARGNLSVSAASLRDEAAELGYEGIRFGASLSRDIPLARGVILALSAGYESVGIPYTSLVDGGLPNDRFAAAGSLNQRLAGTRYVGPLSLAEGVTAHLFEMKETGRWSLWFWSESGQPVEISTGDATSLVLTDAFGNPRAMGDAHEGRLAISLGTEVWCLSGDGGQLMAGAATARVTDLATQFTEYTAALGDDAPVVGNVALVLLEPTDVSANRLAWLGMVRALPELEAEWITGVRPAEVAVPGIEKLARLARAAAVMEQEIGAPFLDPLHERLARCEEFVAEFESAGRASDHRTTWLRDEVSRLMEDARELKAAGRPIEASAVGALAEWRARSLLEYIRDRTPADPVADGEAETPAENTEEEDQQ